LFEILDNIYIARNAIPSSGNQKLGEKTTHYTQIAIVVILGAILFSGGFVSGIFTQNSLKILPQQTPPENPPLTQPPPQTVGENLTVQSHVLLMLSRQAVQLNLKNTGTTDVQIADVKMNGYSNQTFPAGAEQNITTGWNGTTFLKSNQTGPLYVYLVCYFHVINRSMPSLDWQGPFNQTGQEELDLWSNMFNCTFTLVTATQNQYNYTMPALGNYIVVLLWMGALTVSIMPTEQMQIMNVQFGGADATKYIAIWARNTGTDTITVNEVQINGHKQNMTTPLLPQTVNANTELTLNMTYTWIEGNTYNFKLISSKGNQFQYTATSPAI